MRYCCRECQYRQISLKVWESGEKNGGFIATASETPYCTIRHIFSWPWHSCKLYASSHHPHTTLATGEWKIFWPGWDGLVEMGSLSVATILKSRHPYMAATSNLTVTRAHWMCWLTKYTNKKCISLCGTSCMCTLSASALIEPLLHVHQFEQLHVLNKNGYVACAGTLVSRLARWPVTWVSFWWVTISLITKWLILIWLMYQSLAAAGSKSA